MSNNNQNGQQTEGKSSQKKFGGQGSLNQNSASFQNPKKKQQTPQTMEWGSWYDNKTEKKPKEPQTQDMIKPNKDTETVTPPFQKQNTKKQQQYNEQFDENNQQQQYYDNYHERGQKQRYYKNGQYDYDHWSQQQYPDPRDYYPMQSKRGSAQQYKKNQYQGGGQQKKQKQPEQAEKSGSPHSNSQVYQVKKTEKKEEKFASTVLEPESALVEPEYKPQRSHSQSLKKGKKKKNSVPEAPKDNSKKVFKLGDHDSKNGKRVLLVLNIALKNKNIEATIREDTDLNLLSEKISLVADFKSFPKKFKEIFTNYLKNEFKSAMKDIKIEIVQPSAQPQPTTSLNSYNIHQSQIQETVETPVVQERSNSIPNNAIQQIIPQIESDNQKTQSQVRKNSVETSPVPDNSPMPDQQQPEQAFQNFQIPIQNQQNFQYYGGHQAQPQQPLQYQAPLQQFEQEGHKKYKNKNNKISKAASNSVNSKETLGGTQPSFSDPQYSLQEQQQLAQQYQQQQQQLFCNQNFYFLTIQMNQQKEQQAAAGGGGVGGQLPQPMLPISKQEESSHNRTNRKKNNNSNQTSANQAKKNTEKKNNI